KTPRPSTPASASTSATAVGSVETIKGERQSKRFRERTLKGRVYDDIVKDADKRRQFLASDGPDSDEGDGRDDSDILSSGASRLVQVGRRTGTLEKAKKRFEKARREPVPFNLNASTGPASATSANPPSRPVPRPIFRIPYTWDTFPEEYSEDEDDLPWPVFSQNASPPECLTSSPKTDSPDSLVTPVKIQSVVANPPNPPDQESSDAPVSGYESGPLPHITTASIPCPSTPPIRERALVLPRATFYGYNGWGGLDASSTCISYCDLQRLVKAEDME
ncbi:hypothetical protein BDN72DRAFT_907485, partial [Pluteus cervinus]